MILRFGPTLPDVADMNSTLAIDSDGGKIPDAAKGVQDLALTQAFRVVQVHVRTVAIGNMLLIT